MERTINVLALLFWSLNVQSNVLCHYGILFCLCSPEPLFRSQYQCGTMNLNKGVVRKTEPECGPRFWDLLYSGGCLDDNKVPCLIDDVSAYPRMKRVCGPGYQNVKTDQFVPRDVLAGDHTRLLRFFSVIRRAMVRRSSRMCPGFSVAPPALTFP